MSVQYGAISWNRQKKVYDLALVSLLALYLAVFVGFGAWRNPSATAETLLIRALGSAAFLLLNLVLCIGPLSRLDRRFLPLLYNRRHLGVTTFLLGLAHGGFGLVQFHALGNVNPLVSLFISNPRYSSVAEFPFQALGFLALVILFLMAATSHDFWLRNLSAPIWKRLHMLVYVAYSLLVAHVTLGALQSETSPVLASVLIAGVATVLSVHLAAAFGEKRIDRARHQAVDEGFVEVCKVDRIAERCATIVSLSGERATLESLVDIEVVGVLLQPPLGRRHPAMEMVGGDPEGIVMGMVGRTFGGHSEAGRRVEGKEIGPEPSLGQAENRPRTTPQGSPLRSRPSTLGERDRVLCKGEAFHHGSCRFPHAWPIDYRFW